MILKFCFCSIDYIEKTLLITDCFLRLSLLWRCLSIVLWKNQVPHSEWRIWTRLLAFDYLFRFLFALFYRNIYKNLLFGKNCPVLWSIGLLKSTHGILIRSRLFFFLLLLNIDFIIYILISHSMKHFNKSKFQFNQ